VRAASRLRRRCSQWRSTIFSMNGAIRSATCRAA
jgi:hypothetical protein